MPKGGDQKCHYLRERERLQWPWNWEKRPLSSVLRYLGPHLPQAGTGEGSVGLWICAVWEQDQARKAGLSREFPTRPVSVPSFLPPHLPASPSLPLYVPSVCVSFCMFFSLGLSISLSASFPARVRLSHAHALSASDHCQFPRDASTLLPTPDPSGFRSLRLSLQP